MRRLLVSVFAIATLGTAASLPAVAAGTESVHTSDFVVPDRANFTIDADWSSMLGDITDGQVVNCKDGNRTYTKTTDISDPDTGIATPNKLRLANKVVMRCSPELAIANTTRSLAGTFSSGALGVTDGDFALTCLFNANLSLDATVSVGLGVAGLAKIDVTSASELPIACTFTGTGSIAGESSSVSGTIEGYARIGRESTTTCAAGVTGCVPFSVSDARVTITDATGALSDYSGSGFYSYSDTFLLDEVVTAVNAVKRRAGIRAARTSVVSTPSSMSLSLERGTRKAVILRPAPIQPGARGVLTPRSPFVIAAPAGSVCKVKLKVGNKTFTSATSTNPSGGRVTISLSRTTLSSLESKLTIKLKNKPVVLATPMCTTSGGVVMTPAPENIKLSL